MRIDNLDQSELERLVRRVEKLERAAPIGFSSITRGSLRVASPEGLIVEGSEKVTGTLDVTGTLTIEGTLNGNGTITWTGPATLSGDATVAGPLHVNGATDINGDTTVKGPFHVQGSTDITGTLAVAGATTLSNDLTVGSGGKISLGGLSLESSPVGAGAINFLPTGGISASIDGSIIITSPDLATMVVIGGGKITVNGRAL